MDITGRTCKECLEWLEVLRSMHSNNKFELESDVAGKLVAPSSANLTPISITFFKILDQIK